MIDRRQAGSGQMRRGGRSFDGSIGNPVTILGATGRAWWDAAAGPPVGSGVADSWTDLISGIAVAPPGTSPDYATDGANFRGLPVVKTAITGSKVLENTAISPVLLSNGDAPYFACVARNRTLGGPARMVHMNALANFTSLYQNDDGLGVQSWELGHNDGSAHTAASGDIQDTSPHFFECLPSTLDLAVDGVTVASDGNAGLISADVTQIGFGRIPGSVHLSDTNFAAIIVAKGRPTASQRAALLRWARSAWGTP